MLCATTAMFSIAMPYWAVMWSAKVCTSRTEVPRLGLKPRAPGESPCPRASQANTANSGRLSSSTTCAMRPECSWPRWKSRIAPLGVQALGVQDLGVQDLGVQDLGVQDLGVSETAGQ